MHGVFITKGISDWQIAQHEQGYATLAFSGTYRVPQAALEVGTKSACPVIRVMSEDDNSQIVPWTAAYSSQDGDVSGGTWKVELRIPAGGLYRIETGLDTKSTKPGLGWIFRGDVRLHVGIGDIFVAAGQSNSSGYGRDSAFDPPMTGVHLYRNRGSWDLACHPINESTYSAGSPNAEMGVSGVSPYISFGKRFKSLSHYPVGLISAALGGSPVSRWNNEQKGDLYRNMISRIRDCGGKGAGILWYQGCSDAVAGLAEGYYESFRNFVAQTRQELGYQIPFFTFQLNRQLGNPDDSSWGIVREAQRRASFDIPGVYILPTTSCPLSDGIHNNAHASMMLGEKMARLCGSILYNTPEYYAPDISSAECRGSLLSLCFKNLRRGLVIYNSSGSDCGFTVKDTSGNIPVVSIQADTEQPHIIKLELERPPLENAVVSYGWEADPAPNPIVDEVTYLPILSFYEFAIIKT